MCPDTIVSRTIGLTCDVVTGIRDTYKDASLSSIKVFPNPASEKVTVELPTYIVTKSGPQGLGSTTVYHNWKSTLLLVYDLNGQQKFSKVIPKDQTQLEMNVSGWEKGMYYFKLIYNKQAVAGEKVVIN